MSIQEELRDAMKAAMRAKDQAILDVIRQIESEIGLVKTAAGFSGQIDDALYRNVITAYVKKLTKSRKEYESAGERARAILEKIDFEVSYLARWLPKTLDEAQTRELVQKTIAELGVSGASATGRVIGSIMKSHRETVDGSLVNRLVKEHLQ